MAEFDFCPNTRVAEELPPEEPKATSMNGWDFTAKPRTPYRRTFKVTLEGLRWYMGANALDVTTDLPNNAGRLLDFYRAHRTWKTFTFAHEYLGTITCRFDGPVTIPKAIPNSRGLCPPIEVTLVHHNPGY